MNSSRLFKTFSQFLIVAQMEMEETAPSRPPTCCTTRWRTEPTGATCPWSRVAPALLLLLLLLPSLWKASRRERGTWGFNTSLRLPVLTRLWKTKVGDTSQRPPQPPPPPPPVAPPVSVGVVHLQNPTYWQAAHSMTTRSIYGDGTGFRVTSTMNYSKHNRCKQKVLHHWTID